MNPTRSGRKVGLALGSGAARGLAHIGVLEVLHNEGIPVDMIAGTSAGAVFGAIYTNNTDTDRIKHQALELNWKTMSLIDPVVPRSGFIRGRKILELISRYIDPDTRFSDLKIPFACVATDIDTGDEVVIENGPLLEALRASISIPAIFTVVKRGDRYLVDGGLSTPVPVDVAKRMGADFIIAVNVMPDVTVRSREAIQKRTAARKKAPNVFHVMLQSIYISTYMQARSSMQDADIIIEPDLDHLGAGDFNKAEDFIARGEEAAQAVIPQIKKALKGL